MKIFRYKQFLKESYDFNEEDIEDLFQDFRDNYYQVKVEKYRYGGLFDRNNGEVSLPGVYDLKYHILIVPDEQNDTLDDLTEKFRLIIKQLKVWGFEIIKGAGPYSELPDVSEYFFKNGQIYNGENRVTHINIHLKSDEKVEYSIEEYISDRTDVDIDINGWFDYVDGLIGYSNFNFDDIDYLISQVLGRRDDSTIESFLSYDDDLSIYWSLLDPQKEDYHYDIYDLVSDYYNDFESLLRNSLRLKVDREMSMEEMIDYLQTNYEDLIEEIFQFLSELKNIEIYQRFSLYLQDLLVHMFKIEVFDTGIRIYFPTDQITYSLFVSNFDRKLSLVGEGDSWKSFIKKHIKLFNQINMRLVKIETIVNPTFSYEGNTKIQNMIHKYEN